MNSGRRHSRFFSLPIDYLITEYNSHFGAIARHSFNVGVPTTDDHPLRFMTGALAGRFNISVVIPAFNAADYLPFLLKRLEGQTLLPNEIVIVDSSSSNKTKLLIDKWNSSVPIVYKKVHFAYPGHARNIGVELAKGEWIAFIDCQTLPCHDWLERSASAANESGALFVRALCLTNADTTFKEILRAATCGEDVWRPLPGSIVLKTVFEKSGGFTANVRAGEDLEWLDRMKSSEVKQVAVGSPTITYHGFSQSLPLAIKKWFVYAIANAAIEVRNSHKSMYLAFFVVLTLFLVYRWNAIIAKWDLGSIYYLPNITKIFVVVVIAMYIVYRGLIRPLQVKMKASFLLPWRWIAISFVGMCLDFAKAPGLLWGSILLLNRRIRSAMRKMSGQKS